MQVNNGFEQVGESESESERERDVLPKQYHNLNY